MSFVRQATLADLAPITSFDEWDVVTEERIRSGTCYVAGLDDVIMAYGIFDRSFFGRPFVATLFVHPDHRRSGLGSALMSHFEDALSEGKLWISTSIENLPMQTALHKRGFRLSGVVNDLGRVPELVYHKVIVAK